VIPAAFDYARADSLDDALALLAEHGDDASYWPAATRCCH